MPCEIVFDKAHSVFVDHEIQEVYDELAESQRGTGQMATFTLAGEVDGANSKRVDVRPGAVRCVQDRRPPEPPTSASW